MSVYGDYAILGAYRDDVHGQNSGSAHIFHRGDNSTWVHHQKLTASDAAPGDYFGFSVSLSGQYAIVGAYMNGGSGSAYIFKRSGSTWTEEQKITASNAQAGDYFGFSVSMTSDHVASYAIVGAAQPITGKGKAYVFELVRFGAGTIWSQNSELVAPNSGYTNRGDEFGCSVSISGNSAIVGAMRMNGVTGGIPQAGAAFIFERNSSELWAYSSGGTLTADVGTSDVVFGLSVSISRYNTAIVSANGINSAYIFTRSEGEWSRQKITTNVTTTPAPTSFSRSGVSIFDDFGAGSLRAMVAEPNTFFQEGNPLWSQMQSSEDVGGAWRSSDGMGYRSQGVAIYGSYAFHGSYVFYFAPEAPLIPSQSSSFRVTLAFSVLVATASVLIA